MASLSGTPTSSGHAPVTAIRGNADTGGWVAVYAKPNVFDWRENRSQKSFTDRAGHARHRRRRVRPHSPFQAAHRTCDNRHTAVDLRRVIHDLTPGTDRS